MELLVKHRNLQEHKQDMNLFYVVLSNDTAFTFKSPKSIEPREAVITLEAIKLPEARGASGDHPTAEAPWSPLITGAPWRLRRAKKALSQKPRWTHKGMMGGNKYALRIRQPPLASRQGWACTGHYPGSTALPRQWLVSSGAPPIP
uniref:Uncharacterized protein n=1 Tax=Oryza meridionalis TaxID=40149 RepID=A0A0E0EG44_9ORYZ